MAFTDDQIQAINAAPNTATGFGNPRGSPFSALWGGGGVGGPMGQWSGFGGFTPGQPPSLWDKLLSAVGKMDLPKTQMPGTTVGAPAGQTPPAPSPMPVFPPGQRPPGMGAYFQALQNPAAGGGGNMMQQYMALQQLMRGG